MTMNQSIKHDYQLEAEPARKTMNAYALHLEMFHQLNTEEAPCHEGNREEHWLNYNSPLKYLKLIIIMS